MKGKGRGMPVVVTSAGCIRRRLDLLDRSKRAGRFLLENKELDHDVIKPGYHTTEDPHLETNRPSLLSPSPREE
jgi:hypothetical protein